MSRRSSLCVALSFLGLGLAISLPAQAGRCARSDALEPGQDAVWYRTVAPSEHYDSARSQRFPDACTLAEITGSAGPYTFKVKVAPAAYPFAYNVATRDADELFVYGGYPGQGDGAYVAKLDASSLQELWRSHVTIDASNWSFIGAMGVLGNGDVYSIQSNVLARFDPETGETTTLRLPQLSPDKGGTGAAYNGFVLTPDGLLIAKSMERGACDADGTGGIPCVVANNLPSRVVVIDPASMTILARASHYEAALGRIMTERHDGIDYIYLPGLTALARYRYVDGELSLDADWGPVPYGSNGANASGVGLMGDYAVTQTNYLPSIVPSYFVAANIHDGSEQYAAQVFTPALLSWVPDKAAIDPENGVIYGEDTYAGEIAALDIVPGSGWRLKWKKNSTVTAFPALVGPAESRELVIAHLKNGGDSLRWRSTADGSTLAKTAVLASLATVGVPAPGFGGRYYYPSFDTGELVMVRPKAE